MNAINEKKKPKSSICFQKICGFVSPGGWDKKNHITNFYLIANDKKIYMISTLNTDIELLKYLKKWVAVEGTTYKVANEYRISITKIEEAPDPSD